MPYGIIYRATNLVNGKIYIGQTVNSLEIRIKRHILDCKKEGCRHFYRAIKKHGIEAFSWDVLEQAGNQEELNILECENIVKFKSNIRDFGYNIRIEGNNGKHSEETKKIISEKRILYYKNNPEKRKDMSEFMKNYYSSDKNKIKVKEAVRKSFVKNASAIKISRSLGGQNFFAKKINNDEIIEFKTQSEAAKAIGVNQSVINYYLKNNRFGFVKNWSFSYNKKELIKKEEENIKKENKKIFWGTDGGNILEFDSVNLAKKMSGCDDGICRVLNKKRKIIKEWYFSYNKDDVENFINNLYFYISDGVSLFKFKSRISAAEHIGAKGSDISRLIHGRQKSIKGWKLCNSEGFINE